MYIHDSMVLYLEVSRGLLLRVSLSIAISPDKELQVV